MNILDPGGRPAAQPSEKSMSEKTELRKNLFKALLLAVLLITVLAVVHFSPLGDHFKVSNIDILQKNPFGILVIGLDNYSSIVPSL